MALGYDDDIGLLERDAILCNVLKARFPNESDITGVSRL